MLQLTSIINSLTLDLIFTSKITIMLRDVMNVISSFLREEDKLDFESAQFLTVISGTSTDAAVIEQETVLL